MPSSNPEMIPKVLSLVTAIGPRTILDVGCGNGRYGYLFREFLDLNYGRLLPEQWITRIDAIEIEPDYISIVHKYAYNTVKITDWLDFEISEGYDLIFLGDVLEHFPDPQWESALVKATTYSKYTIVVCPNWKGSIAQKEWHGYEHENHQVVLSPQIVGGRCIFANSRTFMCVFDNAELGLFDDKNVCL